MNYKKGEKIKSVEEFIKEVLAKDKPYWRANLLYSKEGLMYYVCSPEAISLGKHFHAVPKKEYEDN